MRGFDCEKEKGVKSTRSASCIDTPGKEFKPLAHQTTVANYWLTLRRKGLLLFHELGSGKTCTCLHAIDTEIGNLQELANANLSPFLRYVNQTMDPHIPRTLDNLHQYFNWYQSMYQNLPRDDPGVQNTEAYLQWLNPKARKTLILTPASIKGTFINSYCQFCGTYKQRFGEYFFFSSYNNSRLLSDDSNLPDSFDDWNIVIDEAHRVINGKRNGSKIASEIYDRAYRAKNCKIMLLSGTPLSRFADLYLVVDLLSPGRAGGNLDEFNKMVLRGDLNDVLHDIISYVPQIQGNGTYPDVEEYHVSFTMTQHQYKYYSQIRAREKETEQKLMGAEGKDPLEIKRLQGLKYVIFSKIQSRRACNFVYPEYIEDEIEEERKLRFQDAATAALMKKYSIFKIMWGEFKEQQPYIAKIMEDLSLVIVNRDKNASAVVYYFVIVNWYYLFSKYIEFHKLYPGTIINPDVFYTELERVTTYDNENYEMFGKIRTMLPEQQANLGITLSNPDVHKPLSDFVNAYAEQLKKGKNSKYAKFSDESVPWLTTDDSGISSERQMKYHLSQLHEYSPKFAWVMIKVCEMKGKAVVYSFQKTRAGLYLFLRLFTLCGLSPLIFSGDLSTMKQRDAVLDKFNADDNVEGEKHKVLLISGAGTVGINLCAVRAMFIMEPEQNEYLIRQVKGRGNRYLSHHQIKDPAERNLKIYRLFIKLPKQSDIQTSEETKSAEVSHISAPSLSKSSSHISGSSSLRSSDPSLLHKLRRSDSSLLEDKSSDELVYQKAQLMFIETEKVANHLKKCSFDCKQNYSHILEQKGEKCYVPSVSEKPRFVSSRRASFQPYLPVTVPLNVEIDINTTDNNDFSLEEGDIE